MKHIFKTIILVCSIMFFLSTSSTAQFQIGNLHLGVYTNTSIHNNVELKWKFKTDGAVRSTPVVVGNKIIIGSTDGFLYCLSEEGKELWKFHADGSISSTPAIVNGTAYFSCRKNNLYAVEITRGKLLWKKNLGIALPYDWGFDYYIGSPSIENGKIYIGSADGNLYSLHQKDGKELWKFKTSSLIRSTPAIDEVNIYFGDCAGKVFALNKMTGNLQWQFSTIGDTLDNENFGFDRKAVIASPTLYDKKLFVGGRDGYLYALDKSSGKQLWNFDYAVSWVISTVAVKNDILVTGTSDGRFIHAITIHNGKELWRFMTQATVWASPAISENGFVVIPSNDGYVYSLDLETGKELWRFKIGPQIFSSPFLKKNMAYVGSDDGYLYSLETQTKEKTSLLDVKRAVFWMKDPVLQSFRSGMDVYVRDYFIKEGYEFYDETDVKDYLLKRIHSDTASVLVFATNYFLPSLTNDTLGSNILQAYLKSGGRIVLLGMNPAAYQLDSSKKQVTAINFDQAKQQTGISYRFKDLRTHGGFYASFITDEGKRWGLRNPFTAITGMSIGDVTKALAIDERGNATAWIKTFSQRENSGFVQLYLTPDRLHTLPEIQNVIEYKLK
ncbi:MAG: PQQ-binding-like beta-propeller repeat protein [Bacteroidota bacterium]